MESVDTIDTVATDEDNTLSLGAIGIIAGTILGVYAIGYASAGIKRRIANRKLSKVQKDT
jgi:hypothetical protein